MGGRPYQGAADVAKVYRAFATEGATVVLQSLHRSWAPLARFCRDLELALTHPVQANAYLTPAGATALAPHHDTHDVFVLQVHGRKHWEVRQPVVEAPLPRHRSRKDLAALQPLLFHVDLAPGDCLYLPRGFVHTAHSQEDASLHVTLGVHALTGYHVLQAVLQRAAEHPAFRAALPVGFARGDGGDALAEAVDECVREAGRWLAALDTGPVAAELRHGFWSRRLPLMEGQLQQLVGLDQLDDQSVVRRRPAAVCEIELGDDGLRLLLGDRELAVPLAVEPAVRRLVEGPPAAVAALADLLDASSRLVLVRRLVLEGVLEVVGGA